MALNLDPSNRPGLNFADTGEVSKPSGIVIKRRTFPDNWPWPRVASKRAAMAVDKSLAEAVDELGEEMDDTKEELAGVQSRLSAAEARIPDPATEIPQNPGNAAVGSSTKYAREDHVHQIQNSVTGSSGSCTGNSATASKLLAPVNIGGVAFDGSKSIDLPGVNIAGNQDTTGNAATATKLAATKTISVDATKTDAASFDGSANVTAGVPVTITAGTATNTLPSTAKSALSSWLATVRNCLAWLVARFNSSGDALTAVTATSAGTCTGNAATATKLSSAKSLTVNLARTASSTFDGSAAQDNIPVKGILPVENGGTGTNSLNFVELSGAQTVGGAKIFTSDVTVQKSSVPAVVFRHTGMTKGTIPSSNLAQGIYFYDSQGGTSETTRMAHIRHFYNTSGENYVGIGVYAPIKGSTLNTDFRFGVDASGNSYSSVPTVSSTDNSDSIATTRWVRNRLASIASPDVTPVAPVPTTISRVDAEGNIVEEIVPLTNEELFERLRDERNIRLLKVDGQIAYLNRKIRRAVSDEERSEIEARIAALDAYAEALCDLPDLEGAPWDGGGALTPWPTL